MNSAPNKSVVSPGLVARRQGEHLHEISPSRSSYSSEVPIRKSGDLTVVEESDLLIERLNTISRSFFDRFPDRNSLSQGPRFQDLGNVALLRSIVRSTMAAEKRLLSLSRRADVSREEKEEIAEKCRNEILVPVNWIFEMVSVLVDSNPVEMPEEFFQHSNRLS